MGRTALVLGAGLGGISAAQSLRKALPHDDRVVLVDRAGMGHGNFYAEPLPAVKLRQPHWLWRGAKVLYEKYWLHSRF